MKADFPEGTTEHPINRNRKDRLLMSVWDFGPKHPIAERKHYACNDHPAKMKPTLARAILQIFCESPVLDPMAGIGTTLVEAMMLGMNGVGIEYEEKFADQSNKNIHHTRQIFPDRKLGKAVCIQGDSRDLNKINDGQFNSILFSPPYGEQHGKGGAYSTLTERSRRNSKTSSQVQK